MNLELVFVAWLGHDESKTLQSRTDASECRLKDIHPMFPSVCWNSDVHSVVFIRE
jgi:hypothetical protein